MVKTNDEICRLAARELGVTPVEQQAEGGRFIILQEKFAGVLDDLRAREIAGWPDDQNPDDCADALAVYLAQKAALSVGAAPDIIAEFRAMGQKPYMDVIAVAGRKWSGKQTEADRF